MFIVSNYALAVSFCIVTMLCWGSWSNTQKLAGKTWGHALFYWDYVIGIFLFSIISAFTLGSFGEEGRSFLTDLGQADFGNIGSAIFGGAIFNAANLLLTAAIALAGMSVAFPVGIGLALVLGVIINFIFSSKGDAFLLFSGVGFVIIAIIANAIAYKKMSGTQHAKDATKGIVLALIGGLLMSLFYYFVAASMDLNNFSNPEAGKMTPYTAMFIFSCGVLLSNFVFNTYVMRRPFHGLPVTYSDFFKGKIKIHCVGIIGGCIWGLGNAFNLIAAGTAGAAISYGLGQGATLVAALWGVFIWKEFRGAGKSTHYLLTAMFFFFVLGLGLIIAAGN